MDPLSIQLHYKPFPELNNLIYWFFLAFLTFLDS